ncbi:uncharacterized protein LOC142537718 [Primulina tabacum]|uniref:uncharacterized protein LOC142537718 n=1 Tax=Primulina tabacum TaxID=48773 RepID=UPI003F59DBA4
MVENILGFFGMFTVSCQGRSGGFILLWKEQLDITVHSYSSGHIDCMVKHFEKFWRFTGFYGNPEASNRHLSWELLRWLSGIQEFIGVPWLVGGDFNEICFDREKFGGNLRPLHQNRSFRDALDDCTLQDLHGSGDSLHGLISAHQMISFLNSLIARAESLEFYHSDHRPILLELGFGTSNLYPHNSMFRFETHWATKLDCVEVVARGWCSNDATPTLLDRIMKCKLALDHIQELENQIEYLSSKDEIYWKQQSRVNWLAHGDIIQNSFMLVPQPEG